MVSLAIINLPRTLNLGDNVFFSATGRAPQLLGPIAAMTETDVLVDAAANTPRPETGDIILLSPNESIEKSGVIGYEGTVVFTNNSTERAELFAVSTEAFESSR